MYVYVCQVRAGAASARCAAGRASGAARAGGPVSDLDPQGPPPARRRPAGHGPLGETDTLTDRPTHTLAAMGCDGSI